MPLIARALGTPIRRRGLAALAGALLPAPAVLAQGTGAFPNRPIRVVIAFAAGGNSDTMARLIQPRMSEFLSQSVVVENRTGAGGALAAGQITGAPADGHTLLFDAASFVIAQFIHRNLPFDYEKDFMPVGMVAEVPYILAVTNSTGITDLKGYLDFARRSPDGIPYGSPGVGNTGHLAGALLAHRSGTKMEHIPYRGGAEVARDLAAGTLSSGYLSANSLQPVIDAGKARPIALTSGERRGGIEGVPTIAESGFPGFDLTSWNAIFCRSGTPEPVRRKLEEAVNFATQDEEVRRRLAAMGAVAVPAEADKLNERLARERLMVRGLMQDTGISFG
ncbi:Bug family tripartite tricarboxylate transporter substrate binding protein [Roseomonas xinghualingensis]|uniref:Bug family tripartite tricarboxylate transporter substrate binding protein n=1 Tax=Roseomonas xinghualingensis TaxID=2986475 RepID=UPI0021F0B43C|nr:tripartite tricarboxylate transporter substrate-binding protein [Roseomonas sp. SXEYE001]MCV4208977.1 tripartite tricarboxylate transporter substrate-binding protein [Roseomonas sp. SXEYE001]